MIGKPARGDAVERFLVRHRDRYPKGEECPECDMVYDAIDDMLKRYRALADRYYDLDEERLLT